VSNFNSNINLYFIDWQLFNLLSIIPFHWNFHCLLVCNFFDCFHHHVFIICFIHHNRLVLLLMWQFLLCCFHFMIGLHTLIANIVHHGKWLLFVFHPNNIDDVPFINRNNWMLCICYFWHCFISSWLDGKHYHINVGDNSCCWHSSL